jgi:hypothetical protein
MGAPAHNDFIVEEVLEDIQALIREEGERRITIVMNWCRPAVLFEH